MDREFVCGWDGQSIEPVTHDLAFFDNVVNEWFCNGDCQIKWVMENIAGGKQ